MNACCDITGCAINGGMIYRTVFPLLRIFFATSRAYRRSDYILLPLHRAISRFGDGIGGERGGESEGGSEAFLRKKDVSMRVQCEMHRKRSSALSALCIVDYVRYNLFYPQFLMRTSWHLSYGAMPHVLPLTIPADSHSRDPCAVIRLVRGNYIMMIGR